jgi:hypothetical protein
MTTLPNPNWLGTVFLYNGKHVDICRVVVTVIAIASVVVLVVVEVLVVVVVVVVLIAVVVILQAGVWQYYEWLRQWW